MLYQFLPRLADDEYAALEKSIREHGIQVPIVVDENGSVIDGHHRKEIADRLGVPCPRNTASDLDETGKRTLACSLNLDRRHLNREQKREVVAKSLKADPQLSNRQHAERVGVDHKTVGSLREALQSRGEIPHADTHVDSLGRQQPARVEPTVNTKTGEVSADYVIDQADLDAAPELPDEGVGAPRDSGDAEPSGDEGLSLPSPSSRSVTGLDGKTYQRPEPAAPRRAPLTDAFWRATYDLTKVTERLGRLTQDDRFPQNAEKVATANRSDLLRSRDLLQQVIDSIPEI